MIEITKFNLKKKIPKNSSKLKFLENPKNKLKCIKSAIEILQLKIFPEIKKILLFKSDITKKRPLNQTSMSTNNPQIPVLRIKPNFLVTLRIKCSPKSLINSWK